MHHVNFLQPHQRGVQHFSLPEYSENSGKCISITLSTHCETVVLLSKGEIDSKKVRVEFSLENMDMSGFQKGATYPQIKEYVQEHSGLTSICETVQRPAGRYPCPVSNRQSDIQKRMSLFFFVCCKLVSPAQRLSGYPVIYFWGSL